jgi:hypothetical protein
MKTSWGMLKTSNLFSNIWVTDKVATFKMGWCWFYFFGSVSHLWECVRIFEHFFNPLHLSCFCLSWKFKTKVMTMWVWISHIMILFMYRFNLICINYLFSKFVQIDFILSSSLWVHFSLISKFTYSFSLWVLKSVPWVCILLQNQRILKTFNLRCDSKNLEVDRMDSQGLS